MLSTTLLFLLGSCRDPWLTSPTGDQWKPLNYCFLREQTKRQSDLVFCVCLEEGWRGNQVLRMQSWLAWSLLLRLLASASHLPLPLCTTTPVFQNKNKNQSWIPGLGWPVSDQSIFGRHGLEVQSRTKLLVTRFLVVQPRLLFYSPNSRNYSGQETSWMGLPGSLASGQWKQASSTLAGMGAAPGRWWVGG
jgi:hypothetical protein